MAIKDDIVEFDSKNFLKNLTLKPGVYKMFDAREQCIYVGKAKSLKKRVSSYFKKNDSDVKKKIMVSYIRHIEVVVTHTEGEALLLENQLIKQLKPRYNICLRDDKSYPHIYLSTQQDFPRLTFHRGAKKKQGDYFGPYPSAGAVRESLQILQKVFPVRQCDDSFYQNRSRPCLQHQIQRCSAPCVGLINQTDYAEDVAHTIMFLEGKNSQLIDDLVKKMDGCAKDLKFEKAAQYRNQIAHLRKLIERQYVSGKTGDVDVVACLVESGIACVQVFFIRNGQHLGNRTFFPKIPSEKTEAEVLAAFLLQLYLDKKIPKEILISHPLEELALVQEVLSKKAERKVSLFVQPRGARARWLKMAKSNAQVALAQKKLSRDTVRERLRQLTKLLDLNVDIQRIECFDISHTQGDQTVASCVVLNKEGLLKSAYRRFNIAGVQAGDDCAALAQAVSRHFLKVEEGDRALPDVLVIDGGRGQVSAVTHALSEIKRSDIFVIGLSKGSDRKVGMEKIYRAIDGKTIIVDSDESALLVLQQVRDEAHRFAISGHRQQRAKAKKTSTLEKIEGLGPKRRQKLLKQFGGLSDIKSAGVEDLCTVDGINKELGQRIYDRFHDSEAG
ncbi:MAG: excinuclease ABC subunit C [Cycloclasticus sp. symbiont of Poecilosclerida sp. M]|nr:MAG: excinuclease ABC subunit C [Cycloclasticus sp. symbiont of Poecilosclerida sp. M]